LSLGVVIHEIEKRIKELHRGLESKSLTDLAIIADTINTILNMIEGYAKLITSNNKKDVSLTDTINKSIMNSEFRFIAHKVTVNRNYLSQQDQTINCVQNIIIGVFLNIFDNSIYWLDKRNIKDKKIFITIIPYEITQSVLSLLIIEMDSQLIQRWL